MAPSASFRRYDVFLSFRGEDTRKGFVSHLYRELDRVGVNTFKDDLKLQKGKCIPPELLKAIEESRFSIVVISANYASSSWCLDELVKIIGCMENNGQTVIPIFYEVNPSDFRKQTENFMKTFKKLEENFKDDAEKLQKWKDALAKVANIAGEDSRNWMEDSKLIQKVVMDILGRLNATLPRDFSELIGLDAHIEVIEPLLRMDSGDEVRVIGICGIGGVGKTTLAKFLFKRLSCQFQADCFFEDVNRIYKTGGLERLQERFLSLTLRMDDLKLQSFEVGCNMIKTRLQQLKVLVVLDDVDGFDQLDALANNTNWFGPGSRVIITTRDKHLLVSHGVKLVCEVKCLSHDNALRLFNRFAFKEAHAEMSFLQLSIRAVNLAGGLPLALKVLGSFLCGRTKEEWESALYRLGRSPHKDIMQVLRVSYDGLDEQEKNIFLHIACLFGRESVDRVATLLDACGYSTKIGVQVLAGKSLLDVSSHGCIEMHDLLQQMGREIVYQQSTNEPGKRKFLWDPMDISDMLSDNTGTEAVEGLSLNMSEATEVVIENGNAFERMHNLKFLEFHGYNGRSVQLPAGLSCFPRRLRLLRWLAYPLESLPFRYRPECLVELSMPFSNLRKLWEGIQLLANLREIDLHNSQNLEEIPDLSKATNLEILDLSSCKSLVEVSSSIQSLNKLSSLYLSGCINLKCLPRKINSKALKLLHLYGCSSLKSFPEMNQGIIDLGVRDTGVEDLPLSFGCLSFIVELNMSGCAGLRILPRTIGNLTSLESLKLWNCKMLGNLPNTIQNLKYLKSLEVLGSLRMTEFPYVSASIEKIILIRTAITEIPSWIENLFKLQYLDASKSKQLNRVPASIFKLKSLRSINLSGCLSLELLAADISDTMSCLSGLQELNFSDCKRLKSLPSGILKLKSLKSLKLSGCLNLESLPTEIDETSSNLIYLNLDGTLIKDLPANFGYLAALSFIYAENTEIKCIPPSFLNRPKILRLGRCSYERDGAPFKCPPVSSFFTLEDLCLKNLNMPEIPNDLGHLQHLKELDLSGNDFVTIPASIKSLKELHILNFANCQKLRALPELPVDLGFLLADGCLSLEKASPAFKNHIALSIITNCFNLDDDIEQVVHHMASAQEPGKSLSATLLPGGSIPGSFNCKAAGPSVSIHLPHGRNMVAFAGFIACIVVATEGRLSLGDLSVRHHCDFKSKHCTEAFSSCSRSGLHKPCDSARHFEIQSDHIFIINFNKSELRGYIHEEVVFDEVSFEFHLQSSKGASLPSLKVKECGVRLKFIDDREADSEGTMTLSGPSSESAETEEEEVTSIEKPSIGHTGEEHNDFGVIDGYASATEPAEEENTMTLKRCFELVHDEVLSIADMAEEEPKSKRLKSGSSPP